MLGAGGPEHGSRRQYGGWGAILYNMAISRYAAHDGQAAKAGDVDQHRVGDGAICVDSLMHAGAWLASQSRLHRLHQRGFARQLGYAKPFAMDDGW